MNPPEEPRSRQTIEPEAPSVSEQQPGSEAHSPAERSTAEHRSTAEEPTTPLRTTSAQGLSEVQGPSEVQATELGGGGRLGVSDQGSASAPIDEEAAAPTFLFFGVVAAVSLVADVVSKAWAEVTMNARGFVPIELIPDHLNIILAYNRGGAWGLLQNASEVVRKPFFLGVSVAAILFIVSLYGKLHPSQKALKWGLPLVLGGALGNLSDRITRSQVIDFIDYQGEWVLALNTFVRRYVNGWTITDHWPTFNVADIAICVGVGLMAVDMFTSRRLRQAMAEQGQGRGQAHDGSPAESRSA